MNYLALIPLLALSLLHADAVPVKRETNDRLQELIVVVNSVTAVMGSLDNHFQASLPMDFNFTSGHEVVCHMYDRFLLVDAQLMPRPSNYSRSSLKYIAEQSVVQSCKLVRFLDYTLLPECTVSSVERMCNIYRIVMGRSAVEIADVHDVYVSRDLNRSAGFADRCVWLQPQAVSPCMASLNVCEIHDLANINQSECNGREGYQSVNCDE